MKGASYRIVFVAVIVVLAAVPAIATRIPLVKESGVYSVPVKINGVISLNFIVDSGAAHVCIPADVALTLMRSKTIKGEDVLRKQVYVQADGSRINAEQFIIRSLEIGRYRIDNVTAAVTPARGQLLLGQNLLERLGVWSLDSRNNVLIIEDSAEYRSAGSSRKPKPLPVSLDEKRHGNLPDDWASLRSQADQLYKQGEYAKAEPYLEKALNLQEEDLGSKDARVSQTASMLIEVYTKQGKTSEADSLNKWADSVWGQK